MSARRHLQWVDGTARAVLRLVPVADPHDAVWQDFAACAETDPEAFFPERGDSTREAKRVCRGCPVRLQCLEYALEHMDGYLAPARFGIWGGTSERERRLILRQRQEAA
jgi:WhiB family redox-sensing transcriptional regulator